MSKRKTDYACAVMDLLGVDTAQYVPGPSLKRILRRLVREAVLEAVPYVDTRHAKAKRIAREIVP